MSKNLTRKGLALGALVALGSTVIAGTPATAAPTALYLESAFGTNLNGVLGQNFVLSSTIAGATAGDVVKYYVEGVTAANLTVSGRYTTDLSAGTGTPYSNNVDADTDASAKIATISSPSWVAGRAYEFGLKLNSTNITETTSVKVTPFLDSVVADGKPGANELTGSPVTIVFNKASGLTATPTLSSVKLGSAVKATVAVSTINLEQFRLTSDGAVANQDFVNVDFFQNGTSLASDAFPAWDTTDKIFVASSESNPTSGKIYGATAQFGTTDSASASLVTATAGEVASLGAFAVTRGTSYRSSFAGSSDVVRSGAGSVSISTTVTAVADKSKAGQKVTYTISETGHSSLDSAATVTAGGKTLKNAASLTTESVDVDVVSGSDGKATLDISYTGIKAGNDFVISAVASGATETKSVATNVTFIGQDSVATAVVDSSAAVSGGTSVRQVAKGSAMSIEYVLVDQFGQTPSGDFQAVITENSEYANFTANVSVSSGKATFSASDNSTADNNYTVTATIQKKNTTTLNWDSTGVSTTSAIQIAAVGTPASITVVANNSGSDSPVARDAVSYVAGNMVIEQESVSRTEPTHGTYLNGTVVGANGAVVDGATVTFTGANLLFQAGEVYAVGSITVRTDASGSYDSIYVFSNKAGKQTVTITSGSASKTQDITFAAVTDGGTTWKTDAPATILPGKTLKVTATLTDKYGNAVDTSGSLVKVSYTGPGFLTAAAATETDADGKISVTVLLGSSDAGPAAIKFTYAGVNGTIAETSSNDDVVATATVAVGAPAVAARLAASTKKFYVGLDNAKGEMVVVKVAGKTVKSFTASSAMQTVVIKSTKGKKSVKVYVAGDLVVAKTLTIK